MKRTRKEKVLKIVAVYVALSMIFQIISPTMAFALTGGPSQPEFESFEPAGTTEMVNLFSGDFNYNIPLMTVPGPNGGYPVNLAYHAGVGMEQEASWVGLGWNLNAGEINRGVRGLPDDFNGEKIQRTISMKDHWNLGFQYEQTSATGTYTFGEKYGFDWQKSEPSVTGSVYYDRYRGIGASFSATINDILGNSVDHLAVPLTVSYGSDDGIGLIPSLSFTAKAHDLEKEQWGIGVSTAFNSRQGMTALHIGGNLGKFSYKDTHVRYNSNYGITFARSSYVPHFDAPMSTGSVRLGIEVGRVEITGAIVDTTHNPNGTITTSVTGCNIKYPSRTVKGNLVYQAYRYNTINRSGYGYLYAQNALFDDSTHVMDFNRDHEAPIKKHSPELPTASATFDSYSISGHGTGGSFRPFRTDIGIVHDPVVKSAIGGIEATGEFSNNIIGKSHAGIDGTVTIGRTYSGQWNGGMNDINNLYYNAVDPNAPLDEPVYLRPAGELTSTDLGWMDNVSGDDAMRLQLQSIVDAADDQTADLAISPVIKNGHLKKDDYTTESSVDLNNNEHRTGRDKRVQSISYRTLGEITNNNNYSSRPTCLYAENTFPGATGSKYSYPTNIPSQIGEITVLNPDGNRYVYGIPAYNSKQVDAVFSIGSVPEQSFTNPFAYSSNDIIPGSNHNGLENYINKTSIPQYAHSYLISAVLGADYVDVTGDGPSADDLGYWVKFNYTKLDGDYKWRYPFIGANVDKGFISTTLDDKGSYNYGEKEIYYLNSIETKTHIAKFYLNDAVARQDAMGVYAEGQYSSLLSPTFDMSLRYLEHVELISKNDPSKILKSVHFKYDYSLCASVPNNAGSTVTQDGGNANAAHGKLTLKEVYIDYLGNTKGSLSPYKFSYGYNPAYQYNQSDRWGTYRKDPATTNFPAGALLNTENPYVFQVADYDHNSTIDASDAALRNSEAAAWCLSQITLPSGSDISINYEADDYAYVQDKNAMQMCRLVGFGDNTTFSPSAISDIIRPAWKRLFFELNTPIDPSDPSPMDNYVRNIDTLYFKAFLLLKGKYLDASHKAWDYVDGFCRVDKGHPDWYGLASASSDTKIHFGYIDVAGVQIQGTTSSTNTDEQPIRKAGFQYLKLSRPDLFSVQTNSGLSLANFASIFTNIGTDIQRIFGFYRYCHSQNYCGKISVNTSSIERAPLVNSDIVGKPSFIRLYHPDGRKYGGGHRVKSIIISDGWDSMTTGPESDFNYGQEYSYVLPDGRSSGVASYEPMLGGEEIPHHMPNKYSDPTSLTNTEELYNVEPYAEDYFPAPMVGYSRVVMRSLKHVDGDDNEVNLNSRSGYSVTEFYTTKDFPLQRHKTGIQKTNFMLPISVPFIGNVSFNQKGYSQGYCIEMNDMNGRLKSTAVYPANADLSNVNTAATSKTEYLYETKTPYSPDATNQLASTVTVLTQDGEYRQADLGKSYDFFVDMNQHSNFILTLGVDLNFELDPASGVIPTFFPSFDYSRALFRSVVAMKVIYRTAILSEVRTYRDGATSSAKNLMYDAETGAPLLTQVTNDFDKPVYTYNYAAHWNYNRMGGAYHNVGAIFEVNAGAHAISSGRYADPAINSYFALGDEVEYIDPSGTSDTYYVTDLVNSSSSHYIELRDAGGTLISNYTSGSLKIVRSGYRNQQGATNGTIVALSNPVTARYMPIFSEVLNVQTTLRSNDPYTYHLCNGDECSFKIGAMTTPPSGPQLIFSKQDCNNCEATLRFVGSVLPTDLSDLDGLDFVLKGGLVYIQNRTTHATVYTGYWDDPNNCFPACLDDVLHADAARFSDEWTFDYADAGVSDPSSGNDYFAGRKGTWRSESNYLFQVDRKQSNALLSSTDISKDGTYKNFTLYKWSNLDPDLNRETVSPQNNPDWSFVSRINRYSPFGYALESQDALGIKSAALYGYDNTKQTAAASNCSYPELAFDGFEDYSGTTYTGHGHLLFTAGTLALQSGTAHTGSNSLKVLTGDDASFTGTVGSTGSYYTPGAGERYQLSVWAKPDGSGSVPSVEVSDGTTTVSATTAVQTYPIEGWYLLNVDFVAPSSGSVTITLKSTGSSYALFDDIRVQPFTSGMVSYVYDPNTHWLLAQLDNRNFATLYQYDEEGSIVQMKQETEKGIMTITTGRSNIKRNQ